MAHNNWQIEIDGKQHTVALEHGTFSGKRKIFIDSQLVHESTKFFDFGGDYPVNFKNHQVVVHIRTNGFSPKYDCSVDGVSIETGQYNNVLDETPSWVWIFVIACVAIPILSLGGAIPFMIGFGAAGYCYQTAKDGNLEPQQRIGRCVFATLVAWGAIILLAGGIGMLNVD